MDVVQDRITTIHQLTERSPGTGDREFAAVVPMHGRELADASALEVVETIGSLGPELLVIPARGPPEAIRSFERSLDQTDCPVELLWCNASGVEHRINELRLAPGGKGMDVWLATGIAALEAEVVCVVDADVETLTPVQIARLLAPIDDDIAFSKAYYARVEDGRLYGRLFRLLIKPLLASLSAHSDDPLIEFLDSFRYALAGEFAVRSDVVREWTFPVDMGLEMGLLGEAYRDLGFGGCAQVDFGYYRHQHRPITGSNGLEKMAPEVVGALVDVIARYGRDGWSDAAVKDYREHAHRYINAYQLDARLNGLSYDIEAEHEQVDRYHHAVLNPEIPTRTPAWASVEFDPTALLSAGMSGIEHRTDMT